MANVTLAKGLICRDFYNPHPDVLYLCVSLRLIFPIMMISFSFVCFIFFVRSKRVVKEKEHHHHRIQKASNKKSWLNTGGKLTTLKAGLLTLSNLFGAAVFALGITSTFDLSTANGRLVMITIVIYASLAICTQASGALISYLKRRSLSSEWISGVVERRSTWVYRLLLGTTVLTLLGYIACGVWVEVERLSAVAADLNLNLMFLRSMLVTGSIGSFAIGLVGLFERLSAASIAAKVHHTILSQSKKLQAADGSSVQFAKEVQRRNSSIRRDLCTALLQVLGIAMFGVIAGEIMFNKDLSDGNLFRLILLMQIAMLFSQGYFLRRGLHQNSVQLHRLTRGVAAVVLSEPVETDMSGSVVFVKEYPRSYSRGTMGNRRHTEFVQSYNSSFERPKDKLHSSFTASSTSFHERNRSTSFQLQSKLSGAREVRKSLETGVQTKLERGASSGETILQNQTPQSNENTERGVVLPQTNEKLSRLPPIVR